MNTMRLFWMAPVLLLAACGDDTDHPLYRPFMDACGPALPRVDCGCFFEGSKDALREENYRTIVDFMAGKNRYPALEQRDRLARLAGEDAQVYWRAAMNCTR